MLLAENSGMVRLACEAASTLAAFLAAAFWSHINGILLIPVLRYSIKDDPLHRLPWV